MPNDVRQTVSTNVWEHTESTSCSKVHKHTLVNQRRVRTISVFVKQDIRGMIDNPRQSVDRASANVGQDRICLDRDVAWLFNQDCKASTLLHCAMSVSGSIISLLAATLTCRAVDPGFQASHGLSPTHSVSFASCKRNCAL